MQSSREMVAEFMRHIGSEVPDDITDRPIEIAGIRIALIAEELLETHAAMRDGDVVGTLDGLCDLKYVIVGTVVAYGLPIDDFFYIPAPMHEIPDAVSAASLMLAATPWLKCVAYALAGRDDLATALHGFDVAISMEAAALGLPLKEAFTEVHRSNMTKEGGTNIGAAKYGKGGKGPGYLAPDFTNLLAAWGVAK